MNQASAFASAHSIVASHGLPRRDIPQYLKAFFVQMFRDDGGNRLADHFLGRVTVEILRILVPSHDNGFEIAANRGAVGRRYYGKQLAAAVLSLGAGLVGTNHWHLLGAPKRAFSVTVRYPA